MLNLSHLSHFCLTPYRQKFLLNHFLFFAQQVLSKFKSVTDKDKTKLHTAPRLTFHKNQKCDTGRRRYWA